MTSKENHQTLPRILYSCYSHISREGEQYVPEHILTYVLSGSSELYVNGKTYFFQEGDIRFIRRNQLAKFVKHPPAGGEYKALSVSMDQGTLQALSQEHELHTSKQYNGEGVLLLNPHILLQKYLDSLAPYLDGTNDKLKVIAGLKVREAIMILLETAPFISDILFDFAEPGKIDLEAYMNEHYKFNVDISRFAYLTGRSLATFKRDFEKVFHTSPNRWLQQKRLHDAYYLIKEKGQKVSEVYLEVGFKDFSHFSFAFKKAYGVAPSRL